MTDRSRLAPSLTLAAMCIGYAVVQLDVTIVNTALAAIGSSLGGGVAELQWIVSTYTISFAALILTAGALGDRLGAKKTFMAGFTIFTAASLAAALAPSATILIAARGVQGLGAALLVPNSLALLNHAYGDEKARDRAVGTWAAGASLALTLGPVAGGVLIALVGWRSIFLVNLPIGLAGLWLTWRYAQETAPSAKRQLDLPGQLAAIVVLGCLAGATIEGGVRGWGDAWVLSGFAGFTAATCLFVAQERREPQPMLPLSLFEQPLFAFTSLVGLLTNVAFYGLIFVFSLYFQQVQGYSPLLTGLAFLPMIGAILPVNLVAARVAERIGGPATIALGATISAIGCLALLGLQRNTGYSALWPQLLALGAGLGLLVPPLTSTLLTSVDKKRSGVAAGALNAARQTGSVIGVALFGSLVGQGDRFIAGTREALIVSAVVLLLAAAAIIVGGRSAHAMQGRSQAGLVPRARWRARRLPGVFRAPRAPSLTTAKESKMNDDIDKKAAGTPNRDPITGAPGAHPVGTGIGAAAGGIAAGAAIGTVAGPVGTAVGAAVGAIVGGLAGKGVAESIDPTVEDAYWRRNYANRPYVAPGASYDDFGPAYAYGVSSYSNHVGRSFDDVEGDMSRGWDNARGKSSLSWDHARIASRDAWDRVSGDVEE